MFKLFALLLRAQTHQAAEKLAAAQALTLLDQQIRDCAGALAQAKKAAAFAMVQHQAEQRRLAGFVAQIADLESRARAALEAGRDDLAYETALVLADLEAESAAARQAGAAYAAETALMRAKLAQSQARLAELQRGRNVARARGAILELRMTSREKHPFRAGLAEAEATLESRRQRQTLDSDAYDAFATPDAERRPQTLAEKLAEAGCGPRLRPSAEDILRRLKIKPAA